MVRLTNQQKLLLCQYHAKHPSLSQARLAQYAKTEFALDKELSQAAISKILKKRSEYEKMSEQELQSKRPRTAAFPLLEEALVMWIVQCQFRRVAISCDIIKVKARKFAKDLGIDDDQIEFSNGWLFKFQQRHKLRSFKLHGEGGSVDLSALEAALPDLKREIAKYSPEDVYNMDETGKMVYETTTITPKT